MDYRTIQYSVADHIGHLMLNRPQALNVSTVFKNDGKVGENRPEQRGKGKGAPSRFLAKT